MEFTAEGAHPEPRMGGVGLWGGFLRLMKDGLEESELDLVFFLPGRHGSIPPPSLTAVSSGTCLLPPVLFRAPPRTL